MALYIFKYYVYIIFRKLKNGPFCGDLFITHITLTKFSLISDNMYRYYMYPYYINPYYTYPFTYISIFTYISPN